MDKEKSVGECRLCPCRKQQKCILSDVVKCPKVGHPNECPLLPENKELETTLHYADDKTRLVDVCEDDASLRLWVALNAIYTTLSQKQQEKARKIYDEVLGV